MKRTTVLLLAFILLSAPAHASILDDIFQKIMPQPVTVQSDNQIVQTTYKDDFGVFLYNLMSLNTPGNVQKLTEEMQKQGISAIKVRVIDYGQDFYVVSGKGVTGYNEKSDRSYQLTKSQITKINDLVQDGDVTFGDKIRIQLIMNNIF